MTIYNGIESMIPHPIREAVRTLAAKHTPLREISRVLKLSRNTVRRILRESASSRGQDRAPCDESTLELIRDAFQRCGGNVVRVQEVLEQQHQLSITYSTLKRWVREAGLRGKPRRCGSYDFAPGQESQHDTSPHKVVLAGKLVRAQCTSFVLGFSRRLFFQYYPRFTRFEAKVFLSEAFEFNEGSAIQCTIDNTSVIVAYGTGADAVMAPEMVAFAKGFGTMFFAHALGHADRKPYVERNFDYIENNFLAGRTFQSWDDLNAQALDWCGNVANRKPKRSLGMSPEAAYVLEKPHLQPLPAHRPPVYECVERVVDVLGYVTLDTNRYSLPERLVGEHVHVYKYPKEVQVLYRRQCVATHPRLIGQRDAKHTVPGHHTTPMRHAKRRSTPPEERQLVGHHRVLDRYVVGLKGRARGRGVRAMRRLLELKRTYPSEPFLSAVTQALRYGLYDLNRLEALILKHTAGDFFSLDTDFEPDQDQ
jgi:hypothetical protein